MNRLHPFIVFLYYAMVITITAFAMNPIILGLSFVGLVWLILLNRSQWKRRSTFWFLLVFLVLTIVNPLFTHNGKTVLFLINRNPITLEAAIYGMVAAGVIVTVLLWCQKLSEYMTTDKTMYLVGRISKKSALLIAMVFRLIPLYRQQARKIRETQAALGLFDKDGIWGRITGHMHVFSAMVTWALEHSVDTADSMRARGYGHAKRTQYCSYSMTAEDAWLLGSMAVLLVFVIKGLVMGDIAVHYYPEIRLQNNGFSTVVVYFTYEVFVLLLPLYESKEKIKWNYLAWKK